MLSVASPALVVQESAQRPTSRSISHISDMLPPAEEAPSQNAAMMTPKPSPKPCSQEIPISPVKMVAETTRSQADDKQTTEYTWPDSLMDVEMTSGSEPEHTTLLPDKALNEHLEVKRALTSLALGRTIEQDRDDIMAGAQLPVITAPLLPSLVPLNEEESLLLSNVKPLQGAALVRAAGISKSDLGKISKKCKGKQQSNSWTLPEPVEPESSQITPHTQEPQYDTRSMSDTYEDLPFSQNLSRMVCAFPNMTEEHLSLTLEKHKNDLPTALAWMQTIADMKHLRSTLLSAYPLADVDEVESAVRRYRGDFMLSFNLLGCTHEPAGDWLDFSFARRRGVMDVMTDAPEVIYDDPAARSFENQWWRTCVLIRWHRVSHSPRADALWPKLAPIAVAPRPISHRFLQYINNLGNYNTNRPLFQKAVGVLRAQQDFNSLVALLGEPRPHFKDNDDHHPALAILHVLIGDGLASPATAAWLALCVFKDPDMYNAYIPLFYGFSAIRRKLWNDRNIHMAASVRTDSKPGSAAASRISAAAVKDTYMSAVPGTIKYALEKQRQKADGSTTKKKADKSSTGLKGSKRSKRIRGILPDKSIPEEEERQGEANERDPDNAMQD